MKIGQLFQGLKRRTRFHTLT